MSADSDNIIVHTHHSFISIGCNRIPGALAYSHNPDLFAYAASSLVAIAQLSTATIVTTLRGHSADSRVSCVCWLPPALTQQDVSNSSFALVSGASDGSLIEWTFDSITHEYQKTTILEASNCSITAIDVIINTNKSSSAPTIVVASSDSQIRVFYHLQTPSQCMKKKTKFSQHHNEAFSWQLQENFVSCAGIPLSIIAFHFQSSLFIAIGNVQSTILLYTMSDTQECIFLCSLKGHEDWIRSLSFCVTDDGNGLLASASQDSFIRLWKFSAESHETTFVDDNSSKFVCTSLGNEGQLLQCKFFSVRVSIESVLAGHDSWVYSVQWKPRVMLDNDTWHQPMCLLSASIDCSMIVWSFDESSSLWVNAYCAGEVGGRSLGCFGAVFDARGKTFIGHFYNGSLYAWEINGDTLQQLCGPSGHNDDVTSLCWEPNGRYLLSCSADKTTRLFAACSWAGNHQSTTTISTVRKHYELARPQIHGYEMTSIVSLSSIPLRFASGAQEKVVRVFDAPLQFISDFRTLCSHEDNDAELNDGRVQRVLRATVPELGLSNKKIEKINETRVLSCPPEESALMQTTMWPELFKLYGHGYEIFALAASADGLRLASSCVSKERAHAGVRIWCTETWRCEQVLDLHGLTVVEMSFSADDRLLLSVSRDRSVSVCERQADGQYMLCWTLAKAHSRIVWSCSWAPLFTHEGVVAINESRLFATGSRDKKVKVWAQSLTASLSWHVDSTIAMTVAVTAVRFLPVYADNNLILAIALEDGRIVFRQAAVGNVPLLWRDCGSLHDGLAHSGRINRIEWNPKVTRCVDDRNTSETLSVELASCGEDSSVRIFDVVLESLSLHQ